VLHPGQKGLFDDWETVRNRQTADAKTTQVGQ